MSGRSSFLSQPWRVLRWVGLAAAVPALWACTSRTLEAPVVTPTQTFTNTVVQKINNNLDILFMIDNSSSMDSMQAKLSAQLPTFIQILQGLPMGLPSVHIAVVSSDMGAYSDQGNAIGCSQMGGDNGLFQVLPRGTCATNSFKVATDMFITDDSAGNNNFTLADPTGLSTVFQCIALLGSMGCGFEHQLASIDHALGSDNFDGNGKPQPPATNAGFLRDGAYLGIIMLTNEDDCSASAVGATTLYSLNGGAQSITNPMGPIANYRCNEFGHLCGNPGAPPPLNPPAGATTLTLDGCISNDDTGLLTPVSTFVQHIKQLKNDPANQILVAAVTGVVPNTLAVTPYTVNWIPNTTITPPENWPAIAHICGPTGDMSFADPAVRIAQFVNAFGDNSKLASICDSSYQSSMTAIANKIGALIKPKCVAGSIQQVNGQPNCTVINHVTVGTNEQDFNIASCASNGGTAPCWMLNQPNATNNCAAGTEALAVSTDPANPMPDSLNSTIQCATCIAGVSASGCPCIGMNDVAGCLCNGANAPPGCV